VDFQRQQFWWSLLTSILRRSEDDRVKFLNVTLLFLLFAPSHFLMAENTESIERLRQLVGVGHLDDRTLQILFEGVGMGFEREREYDPAMGISPLEALRLFFDLIDQEFDSDEQLLIFKDITSIQFVRCGKTALLFHFKERQQYLVIFDIQGNILHKTQRN
ncbi:MAG: hypothetical protein AAF203_03385, partial [Pseudomonadota bacterium]